MADGEEETAAVAAVATLSSQNLAGPWKLIDVGAESCEDKFIFQVGYEMNIR